MILSRCYLTTTPLFLASSLPFVLFNTITGMSTFASKKIIDSHLHVWADTTEASKGFPYADGQDPPDSLKDAASFSNLMEQMNANGVDGSLIVQPINHKFDHSYVMKAIDTYPDKFKGMLLHNPLLSPEEAVSQLENLVLKGFVGVRFNPYLWPKLSDGRDGWTPMSTPGGAGEAVYQRCAELHMPVGIMCFQGLHLHYDDIIQLLQSSPKTTLILDHFGFTSFTSEGEKAFQQLLQLAKYPQVVVKISALFRLQDQSPYERVRTERFHPLLMAFGADRLMFGTDFPFVLEQEPERYGGMVRLVESWVEDDSTREAVMSGTAERIFGQWG
ncbi:amidohydrolase 2 [Nitzschia inconspicua]|uniref:Amidohydrolase 2 n=1 Tax=Nitzschia inconspicua TaxID=303405 RepID=A0A9K3KNZ7_9STRA|nr:amidohydrolase 2 [Nitzschia inconspicua]